MKKSLKPAATPVAPAKSATHAVLTTLVTPAVPAPPTLRMAVRERRGPSRLRLLVLLAIALLPFIPLLERRSGSYTAATAALMRVAPAASAAAPRTAARDAHTVGYDRYSLLVDGRRVVLFGGEYQFWRTPSPERWPVVLREMRAAGLNTVSVGVSWQYNSPAPGVYDFAGIRDLGRFLDDAAAAGLYVIARPGPAYDAESNASNLPGWLLSRIGNLRANGGHAYCGAGADAPAYTAAYTDWYRHVLPIIAARQLTGGKGTVVAVQLENEYVPQCGSAAYMKSLHDLARQQGVTVPLLANNNSCCAATGSWHGSADDGQPIVDIPAEDDYPCTIQCTPAWDASIFRALDSIETRLRAAGVGASPIAVAELEGGYYAGWTGPTYARMSRILDPSFTETLDGSVLGQGATLVSIYMAAGGTSWGYLAGPNTATSYDYGAPIHEWGSPGPGYDALKRDGMFVDAYGDLLGATRRTPLVTATNASLLYAARQTVDGPQRGAQFIVLRNTNPVRANTTRLRLPLTDGAAADTVPRAGAIALPPHGIALLVAHYRIGRFSLLYSTSRPLTHATVDGNQVAVFYGAPGTAGETALACAGAARPSVSYADPGIAARDDGAQHRLLLDYQHDERVRRVVVTCGGARLTLVLTGPQGAAHTWRVTTPGGPGVIVGPALVLGGGSPTDKPRVVSSGGTTTIHAWLPGAPPTRSRIAPGGADIANAQSARQDNRAAAARGGTATLITKPAPPRLPALSSWRFHVESPERAPGFDDSGWTAATERATSNPNAPASDTLLADDYGFHYGFVWYRGAFRGANTVTGVRIFARNSYSVWLNGRYLGSSTPQNDLKNIDDALAVANTPPSNGTYADGLVFRFPPGAVRVGAANTISVLTESLGHNIGFANGQLARSPTGILSAALLGGPNSSSPSSPSDPPPITWRLQGAAGGEQSYKSDPTGSALNASGLYGERNGWYRPGFDDRSWGTVAVPDTWAARGLDLQGVGWYRTSFALNLPAGVDAPLGLVIPHARDKVLIWLNGLLIGRYWEGVGAQHTFYLPAGLLREHGRNTLALAVWNRGHAGGLTGGVRLQPYAVDTKTTLNLGNLGNLGKR